MLRIRVHHRHKSKRVRKLSQRLPSHFAIGTYKKDLHFSRKWPVISHNLGVVSSESSCLQSNHPNYRHPIQRQAAQLEAPLCMSGTEASLSRRHSPECQHQAREDKNFGRLKQVDDLSIEPLSGVLHFYYLDCVYADELVSSIPKPTFCACSGHVKLDRLSFCCSFILL